MANYMLILMEGIYLHNLMFLTLFFDSSHIAIYYTIGWGKFKIFDTFEELLSVSFFFRPTFTFYNILEFSKVAL